MMSSFIVLESRSNSKDLIPIGPRHPDLDLSPASGSEYRSGSDQKAQDLQHWYTEWFAVQLSKSKQDSLTFFQIGDIDISKV
jgi:hypothetical protein